MAKFKALSRGSQLVLVAGPLLVLSLFLTWQYVEVDYGLAGVAKMPLDGWDAWGLLLALLVMATVSIVALGNLTEVELSDDVPWPKITLGLGIGILAVAVPGALAGWCRALQQFGVMPLADAMAPAIQLAEAGFTVTPYLSTCIADCAADLALDPDLAALFLPGGLPLTPGTRLRRPDYAATLRLIASEGTPALYGGPLGDALVSFMAEAGGLISAGDLRGYAVQERAPIRGHYRGFEIVGPPPPASSGVHIVQMLNLLEAFDVRGLGFGTPDGIHLLAEVMKAAFADRAVATADPAFVTAPVERLVSRAFADKRRAGLDMGRAQRWTPGIAAGESAMPGSASAGALHPPSTGPMPPVRATAAAPATTAVATGGTRGPPQARAAR